MVIHTGLSDEHTHWTSKDLRRILFVEQYLPIDHRKAMHRHRLHSDRLERLFHFLFVTNEHEDKWQYDDDVVNHEKAQQEMMIPRELILSMFQVHLEVLQYLLLPLILEYLLVITKWFHGRGRGKHHRIVTVSFFSIPPPGQTQHDG